MKQSDVQMRAAYAAPQAHVEDIADTSDGPVLAGRGARFWAAMIDVCIAVAVFGAVAALTPWNPWRAAEGSLVTGLAINGVFGFAVFICIHGWLLMKRGQTVGKAAMRVRIVRADGTAASAWQLIGLRYGIGFVVSPIPFLGLLYGVVDSLMIFRASRRCVHDLIAGTTVVTA